MILVVGWIFCAGIIALTVILTIILSISVDDSNRFSKEQLQKPQLTKEEFKGHEGEKITARYLEKINGYKHIMNNVIINDNGKTRQIDHIAITENGIFIIETKTFQDKFMEENILMSGKYIWEKMNMHFKTQYVKILRIQKK